MKKLVVIAFALLVLGSTLSAPETNQSVLLFTRIEPSLFNPPEYPIAKPLSGGPLRILFLGRNDRVGPFCYGISARLSCTFESVLAERRIALFKQGEQARPGLSPFSESMSVERVRELLTREWDAIWLDFRFNDLPEQVRTALIDRVRDGSGLVYVGEGSDLRLLAGEREFDSSRLLAVSYGAHFLAFVGGTGKGLVFALPEIARPFGQLEIGDYLALATHALFLASGRETRFTVTKVQAPGRKVELESMSIMNYRIDFVNRSDAGPRKVTVRYRNEKGETAAETGETYLINNGKGFIMVRYPLLPVGEYSADISVFEGEQVVAIAGTSFRVHSDDSLAGIEMKNRSAVEGEYITGRVRTSREIREGMTLTIELLDSWGRRISTTKLVPEPRRLGVDFVFGIRKSAPGAMAVRANLYKSNALAHVLEQPVFSKGVFNPRAFSLVVFENSGYDPLYAVGYERLADEGMSTLALNMTGLTPSEAFSAAVRGAKRGVAVIPVFTLGGRDMRAGSGNIDLKRMLAMVDTLGCMDIPAYAFDAIDGEAASANALASGLIAAAGHDSTVGVSVIGRPTETDRTGTAEPAVMGPRTAEAALANPFDADGIPPLIIGGRVNGMLLDAAQDPQNEIELRTAPWRCLFLGMNTVWWSGGAKGAFPALMPGFAVNPAFSALAGEARAITGGIDFLLSGANPRFDRIALLWDLPAVRRLSDFSRGESRSDTVKTDAGSVFDESPRDALERTAFRSARAFYRACADAGYRPRIVTGDMIRRGLLSDGGVDVLLLPGVRMLSDATARAITRFGERGGTVVADLRPGIMDERLATRANGALDSLFGIEAVRSVTTRESKGAVRFFGTERGMPDGFAIEGGRGDQDIRPCGDARALGTLGDAPAFLLKNTASGRGICFNFDMGIYETLRGNERVSGLLRFFAWFVGAGGIEPPPVAVVDSTGNRAVGVDTFLYEDGDALYIGVLPDATYRSQGCRLFINRFQGESHLFDVRKGLYRGMTNIAPLELRPGRTELFAIFLYRTGNIEVKLENNVVYPGSSLSFQVNVLIQGDTKPVRHVLRVEVAGPDRKVREWLSGMYETREGSFKTSIPVSSADSTGKWMLRIRDVATGRQVERVFIVMPPAGE